MEKNKLRMPFLLVLCASVLLIITFFLPYAAATDEHREYLQRHSEGMYAEEAGITNGEAVDISLIEFARIYAAAIEMDIAKAISIACVVLISLMGLTMLLCLLFSALKKPIPVIVFDCLTFGLFRLLRWDFLDRGVIPSSSYVWGVAHGVYYVSAVVLLVGAIWLLIKKVQMRHVNKARVGTVTED